MTDNNIIAGFRRRLASLFIDGLILSVIYLLFLEFDPSDGYYPSMGFTIAFLGVQVLYFALLNSKIGNGQTFGKRVFAIRVVGQDGGLISFQRAFWRAVIVTLPAGMSKILAPYSQVNELYHGVISHITAFGTAMVIATIYLFIFNVKTRQVLHDLIMKTFVICEDQGFYPLETPRLHKIMAVAIMVLVMIVTMITSYTMSKSPQFQDILQIQKSLLILPDVKGAGVSVQTFKIVHSGTFGEKSLSVVVILNKELEDYWPEFLTIARQTLSHAELPEEQKLSISIKTRDTYSFFKTHNTYTITYTVKEWKRHI